MYKDKQRYKEYQKKYRQINKEKNKKYQIKYRKENREVLLKQMSEYGKKWYKKNKKQKDAQNKEWAKKPENKKKRVEYVQKYVRNNEKKVKAYNRKYGMSLAGFWRRYKYRAKKAGYEMNITLEDFENITSLPCKYCGENERQRGIDRVDNNIGYLKENCVSCCGICNMMKMKLTKEKFLNHIKKIYKNIC